MKKKCLSPDINQVTFHEVNVKNNNNNRQRKKLNSLAYDKRSLLHLIGRSTSRTFGLIYNNDKKCLLHLATRILLGFLFLFNKKKNKSFSVKKEFKKLATEGFRLM